ncbi:gamma-aminobutyric acid type B receptor subunit 2-like isoform X1 [Paramuricea clavata]|uniref:Gamma-aminobutyric acid type B receptor subunit 2-like isoform X1 n=1 Tax=Paramuricea clavata TaxID=317549 RepID=A0A6S7G1T6_PARCT|nr:gamma-aminobutyric acid type B receptor subunit 2-like isoform X1 [Paramuricea clavata]
MAKMERFKCRAPHLAFFVLLLASLARCSSSTKKNVTIPVLAPLYNLDVDRFAYGLAAKYAMDLINNRTDILKDYHLVPRIYDTVASVTKTFYIIHDILKRRECLNESLPPAIIGPSYSTTTIAAANAVNLFYILQYTYGATSPVLDIYNSFQHLVRMYPGTSPFSNAHAALLKKFGWTRVGIVYDHHEHDGIFNKITDNLIDKLRGNNITVVGIESVDGGNNRLSNGNEEIKGRLERLKAADIKIFFAQFTFVRAYRVFCQAYKLGMFGQNYVWIVHPQVETVDKWLTAPGGRFGVASGCSEEDYRLISERMLLFKHQNFRKDGKRSISGLSIEKYRAYMDKHRAKTSRSFLTRHVHSYMFDTVWDMALTLNKSLPILKAMNSSLDKMPFRNKDLADELVKVAFATKFEGITGTVEVEKEQGRIGTLNLYQIRNKTNILVGSYHGTTGTLVLDVKNPDLWIDGRVPNDRSRHRTVLLNIPLAIYLPICTVAGLGVILAIGVLIFNTYHRNEGYIRKSAPLFNNIIILGVMMCLSTVVFFGYPVELGETNKFLLMCKLRTWILCLGFSLSFGSMFVKTWRVYKIFTNRKLKYSIDRLSNSSLIGMVIVIVVVDIFILLLWKFINPMERKMTGADVTGVRKDDAGRLLSDFLTKFMYDLGIDDGLVAVGYSNDDVSDLVRGTVPQHRVTKLAPAGAPGEEELAKLFEASMKIY